MVYATIAIAFGVAGLAWLAAASRPGTFRKIWKPGDTALMIGRLLIGTMTVYVLLTAGGIAWWFGLAAAAFGGLHLFYTRPDKELPRFGLPGPLRWFMGLMNRLERMLIGGR